MKKISYVAILLMGVCLCAGCGKKETQTAIEQALNENKTVQEKEGQENTQVTQEQHVSYTVEGNGSGSSVEVDADVAPYDLSHLPVYDIKEQGMDDAYIKALADRLFDKGEYQYVKPYVISSEEELLAEKDRIREILSFYEDKPSYPLQINDDMMMISKILDDYSPEYVQEVPAGTYYYTYPVNTYKGIEEITTCKFYGQIQGEKWVLQSELWGKYETVTLYPYDQEEPFSSLIDGDIYASDQCSLDKDQGQVQAEECLSQLGFSDYELVDATTTLSMTETDSASMNGYAYTFARSLNGLSTAYLRRFNPLAPVPDLMNTPQQYVTIYVDEAGVEQIDLVANYELGEKLTENTRLLSFEQIDEIVRARLTESLTEVKNNSYRIDQIELHYMVMEDAEGKYSYAPAWIYHINYGQDDSQMYTTDICVSAIDGTILNDKVSFGYADVIGE